MTKSYGGQNMVGRLRRVLVRRPDEAFANADPAEWHYSAQPDLAEAQREHDEFAAILRAAGAEVVYHDEPLPGMADAIFVQDPATVTDAGAVILSMGKPLRRGEGAAMARGLEAAGVPIHASLDGDARAEGGNLLWIDKHTLAAGVGLRTNPEGVRQLAGAVASLGVEVVPIQMPQDASDPNACLHLLSFISLIAHDLAVAYRPLMPGDLARRLEGRGFRFVEVSDEEYQRMAANVLALAPRKSLMLEGNPVTQRRLEAAGCEVFTYRGDEICHKAEGGPTCLARPILRED